MTIYIVEHAEFKVDYGMIQDFVWINFVLLHFPAMCVLIVFLLTGGLLQGDLLSPMLFYVDYIQFLAWIKWLW